MTETGERLRLLYDWASAQRSGQRLAIWILVAILLHAGAYFIFRDTYPAPAPSRMAEAKIYVLLPGSGEARELAPYLAAADPALFATEVARGTPSASPELPAYKPSYSAAAPHLEPLPDVQHRILPPLVRDLGPIPVEETPVASRPAPAPATRTQITFSATLRTREPRSVPEFRFTARPGDQLAPKRFLIAVAPDGRVLHVFNDAGSGGITPGDDNAGLNDKASQLLMNLRFHRGAGSEITWGTATFHWGLDLKREEPR